MGLYKTLKPRKREIHAPSVGLFETTGFQAIQLISSESNFNRSPFPLCDATGDSQEENIRSEELIIHIVTFASPVPFGKWEGTRDGSRFGGKFPQIGDLGLDLGDEDCLNLNVSIAKVNNSQLLPVMVFIHGGAFQNGTGNMFQPHYFMDEDVVYVNPNYRLGVSGFLNTGDTAIRGNIGL
ncbi:unnamed protein product [Allacma fusca]|uniref:Carboxylesterase type B domain-containing protein n=1 Tax=Allacma fusca TaxID=39272 RepID=A0A8J2KSZ8_9HEXA|nr:unnamed protein product [Allacma fusca]